MYRCSNAFPSTVTGFRPSGVEPPEVATRFNMECVEGTLEQAREPDVLAGAADAAQTEDNMTMAAVENIIAVVEAGTKMS